MLEFKLPEVGENITSGTVVRVAVTPGEVISKDQALLELETDKASLEVPAPCDGTIQDVLIKEGDEINIGQVVMTINEGAGSTPAPKTATQSQPVPTPQPAQASKPVAATTTNTPPPVAMTPTSSSSNVAAAPSVRRFAREIGLDIATIPGTGPGGRVSKDDVNAYAKELNTGRSATATGTRAPARALPDFSKWGTIKREKMNTIRKKTAQHLSYCWQTIPHVTQFDKANITELDKLRKRFSTADRKLTISPFLLKVMASALKAFPQFNASVDMENQEIIYKNYVNLGVAVDTDRGLMVPVIKDIDKKSIFQLADELNAIAEKARDKKITLEDLQGGSMTLTNLGGIGGTCFTPIVNWPEVAILGVSRGAWEPFYMNKQFIPRFMLPLSLSYDHRLIDGADGARCLRWICEAIEQPFLMELEG